MAVFPAFLCNEFALAALGKRMDSLKADLRARIETLDCDLLDWATIVMQHNTDIARLKGKAGLE